MTKIWAAPLLMCATVAASACEIPPLVQIPTDEELEQRRAQRIREEFATYYQAMMAYTSCIQAELAAAGGDNAPQLVKAAYVVRNNSAVAEFAAMQKVYDETVGAADAGPPAGAPRD